MKDLLYALSLCTNINLYKADGGQRKFALCYIPLAGLLAGLLPAVWVVIANIFDIHVFIVSAVGTVLCALVGDRFIYHCAKGKLSIIPCILFYVLIWALLFMEPLWGPVLITGVFVSVRVLAVFFFWDKDNIKDGVFGELFRCAHRIITAIMTVVWLMASVAMLQMHSIYYFLMAAVSMFVVLFLFERKVHKKKFVDDGDMVSYVACCEFTVISEFVIFDALKLILGR